MRWRILIPSFCISVVFHTSALKLRSCQGTFLESFLDALKAGSTKIGVHLPAAIRAGETVVFISLLERLRGLPRYPEVIRSLVIVDSVELARQAVDQAQARKLFHHRSVETEQGARCTASGIADVCVTFISVSPCTDTMHLKHRRDAPDIAPGSAITKVRSGRIEGCYHDETPCRCTLLGVLLHPFPLQLECRESSCCKRW